MEVVKMRWAKEADDGLFIVSEGEDGILYASRDQSPFFMVSGETEDDVRRQAHAAIASYFAVARSRTITKDQVEEAARAAYEEYFDGLIGCAEEPWDRLPEQHRERLVRAQIAAARAFGLEVE